MYEQNDTIPLPQRASNALLTLQGRNASNSATIPTAANLPQNIFTNPAIQPSSVINLSNSSDVVIGPMTQYQGPVTIYQYMDATVEARSMNANGGINQSRTNQSTSETKIFSTNSKIAIVVVIALILGTALAIYFTQFTSNNNKEQPPKTILFGNEYESGTFPNLGNGHLVIDREQWGASDRGSIVLPLEHPIPYVLITHVGVQSSPCFNVYKCSIKMRTYQDSSIAEKKLPDISSNFYVGNDGNVYVGRGWNYANTYANKSLAITFMGDYIRSDPDPKQLEAVQYLLSYGITRKYIALDYKLIAQNQTKSSRSPGVNVYREIVKWPHWYPCGTDGNESCGKEIGLPAVWDAKM